MKKNTRTFCGIITGLLLALPELHANYTIAWYKISGVSGTSGGTSTNGQFSVNGAIGQQGADGNMTGGGYSLTGGFSSLISVVQTPGAPSLTITGSGVGILISWPGTGVYALQQNRNPAVAGNWAASGYPVTSANGTNSISITTPAGNLFFRLANP